MKVFVVIQGRAPNGDVVPVELSANHCLRIVPEAQTLALVQTQIPLTTTAADLGATEARDAVGGWELWCAADWYVGDASGQARLVAANEPWYAPGSALAGIWVKSAAGTPNLIVSGGLPR